MKVVRFPVFRGRMDRSMLPLFSLSYCTEMEAPTFLSMVEKATFEALNMFSCVTNPTPREEILVAVASEVICTT